MSFWKKKDNLIITTFVILFFAGIIYWYDLCCVRASFFESNSSDGFQIPFVDGDQKQHTLDLHKGKPLVVMFWATWCPACVKSMGTLNSFSKKFQEKGGEVLAISQDRGGLSAVRAYYTRHDYKNLPLYLDASGKLMNTFSVRGLPTAIFIDAQGKEVDRIVGGVDWESSEMNAKVNQNFGLSLSQ
ncbi:MAG: TlpA family protein disulfide reductase [Alphaproteobacteria bacterium]|nr:TlpA family protein disulfide reductase [Alphaproteobacteria bacterium]